MTTAALTVGSFRRGKQGQDRQGLNQAGPWHRGEHHEAQPAQPAGLDEMAMAGSYRVPVDATCGDPASPSALNGVVQTDDDRASGHEPLHHDAQQPSGNSTGAPSGAVEDLVKGCKVGGFGPAGHAQAGSDRPLARRQQGAHHQNKHMLPAGRRKAGAPCLQPLAQDLGNGIADIGIGILQHPNASNLHRQRWQGHRSNHAAK